MSVEVELGRVAEAQSQDEITHFEHISKLSIDAIGHVCTMIRPAGSMSFDDIDHNDCDGFSLFFTCFHDEIDLG